MNRCIAGNVRFTILKGIHRHFQAKEPVKLTARAECSSAGYAIRWLLSKRIPQRTMAD
jgi:hypothetical protein